MAMHNIEDLIGIPFVDGGRTTDGLDCWGLVRMYYKRIGIDVEDYSIGATDAVAIEKEMKQHIRWQKIEEPSTDALVLFRLTTDTAVNHAGVVLEDGRFVHAYLSAGVCIDRLKKWKSRIVGYYLPIV